MMLGYPHLGYYAKTKDGEKTEFNYKTVKPKSRNRQDYLSGYTNGKKHTAIETIDDVDIREDYAVWLEDEEKYRRVINAVSDKINDLREESYTILELE